jgi:spermidine synthase
MTREAFDSMRRLLKPGGTLVINSFVGFRSGKDFFGASLDKTLKAVFKSVRIHATHPEEISNAFFVASDRPELTIVSQPDLAQVHPDRRDLVKVAFDSLTEANPREGIVLTDDYNPVEVYDAANREAIRRNLALNMRSL